MFGADECVDDVTGALIPFGGCAFMATGLGCDGSFGDINYTKRGAKPWFTNL